MSSDNPHFDDADDESDLPVQSTGLNFGEGLRRLPAMWNEDWERVQEMRDLFLPPLPPLPRPPPVAHRGPVNHWLEADSNAPYIRPQHREYNKSPRMSTFHAPRRPKAPEGTKPRAFQRGDEFVADLLAGHFH
jgi:hypothetical protein